jgi:hypothetical protein
MRSGTHVRDVLTEGSPHLPGHDESTTNVRRAVLSGEDRNGRTLGTHTNTEDETSDLENVESKLFGDMDRYHSRKVVARIAIRPSR